MAVIAPIPQCAVPRLAASSGERWLRYVIISRQGRAETIEIRGGREANGTPGAAMLDGVIVPARQLSLQRIQFGTLRNRAAGKPDAIRLRPRSWPSRARTLQA
jgi:hypothetical protein